MSDNPNKFTLLCYNRFNKAAQTTARTSLVKTSYLRKNETQLNQYQIVSIFVNKIDMVGKSKRL